MSQKTYLCVTIDTECDGSRKTLRGMGTPEFRNVAEGVCRRLQPMLNNYGACGTYFLDWLVLNDQRSMEAILGMPGRFEIGAHLHPEHVTPPGSGAAVGTGRALFGCSDISDEEEMEKLSVLTATIAERTGTRPTSFRAGRFGADSATLIALADLGYKVDSSVTPGISWVRKGGPDFRTAPHQPYWPHGRDLALPGNGPVLEVPVTVGAKKLPFLPDHWFLYDWLRPTNTSAHRMIRLIEKTIATSSGKCPVVLTMMFHSQELIGGTSPYTPTDRAALRLVSRIERVVAYCASIGIEFIGVSEAYDALSTADCERGLPRRPTTAPAQGDPAREEVRE
ncbi:MAG: hypothetical protein HPY44_12905 [Armatimonadetes bacterium]|nr:hypothetical protein [Armatimonadota bacterium]